MGRMNPHTADWSDEDLRWFVGLCDRLEARPLDLAGCWMSESGLSSLARNPRDTSKPPVAVGVFQMTRAALGPIDLDAVQHEPLARQLRRAEAYYGPHRGRLVSPGACYLVTFLPAYAAHANTPGFVLCSTTLHPDWYHGNPVFDHDRKGFITVQDLTDQIARVTTGPRWSEFAARVTAILQERETSPQLPEVREDNRDEVTVPDVTSETFPGGGTEGPAA